MTIPSAFTASLTPAERAAYGRNARRRASRSCHGWFEAGQERPDPVEVIERQSATRVPELVPARYGRMLESPFRFYRGAARDHYVRQLRDWKGIAQPETMAPTCCACSRGCAGPAWPGPTPAPATPSPSPPTWAAVNASTGLWPGAQAYADQNERDFEALGAAARSGRISAESL